MLSLTITLRLIYMLGKLDIYSQNLFYYLNLYNILWRLPCLTVWYEFQSKISFFYQPAQAPGIVALSLVVR